MNNTFQNYVVQLEKLAQGALNGHITKFQGEKITAALDGGARSALNNSVSINLRRKKGVFFTSSSLASTALANVVGKVDSSTVFLDPACGAGDLLLSCSQMLPIEKNLELTLQKWGARIAGLDLQPQFVRAAKARLLLAAISRGKFADGKKLSYSENWFPLLNSGNLFESPNALQRASLIVINPPYQVVDAPEDCSWAKGKVSNAALFMEQCVSHSSPNSRIVAILPDVLRSGSRYSDWRQFIAKKASIENVTLLDKFDPWTDIHVFVLQLRIHKSQNTTIDSWKEESVKSEIKAVGDSFEVHVGAVVPHRDKKVGKTYRYLVAKNLPRWKVVKQVSIKRKFSGTVYTPPFVVVRRTSRPEDKNRAIATVISGNEPVAVENHLLVLQPKDQTMASCRALLKNLRRQETSDWLNQRIRCRHLTVSSLRELPWWSDTK